MRARTGFRHRRAAARHAAAPVSSTPDGRVPGLQTAVARHGSIPSHVRKQSDGSSRSILSRASVTPGPMLAIRQVWDCRTAWADAAGSSHGSRIVLQADNKCSPVQPFEGLAEQYELFGSLRPVGEGKHTELEIPHRPTVLRELCDVAPFTKILRGKQMCGAVQHPRSQFHSRLQHGPPVIELFRIPYGSRKRAVPDQLPRAAHELV